MRQLWKKSLEVYIPAYMCVVDMTKALNKIRLSKIRKQLDKKGIKPDWGTLEHKNSGCETRIKTET